MMKEIDEVELGNETVEIVTPDNFCINCYRQFSTKGNLLRHQKLKTCGENEKKSSIHCPISTCTFQTWEKKNMIGHYEVLHSLKLEKETLQFSDQIEFKKWKESYECDTKAQFIKNTSTKCTENKLFDYYVCYRDGYFHKRGKGVKSIKLLGTNKINAHCPARMDVHTARDDGKVEVHLTKTHFGHTLELGRLHLSESDKKTIAQKISQKVPFQEILNGIRESVIDEELKRIHLITRQDLWNIAESFNLKHYGDIFDKNDCVSVDAWVSQMQKSSTLVRLYKPQGSLLQEFPQLKKEDFFLVIMNEPQLEILRKFGNDVICIDGTHGLNAYDFQLYTILVLDNVHQGFPCSFLFSNRGDSVAMEVYFKVIRNCLISADNNIIYPNTFMSDMDNSFYNAWCAVFGPVQNHLYCSWHVDRAWRHNLNKIKSKEKQAAIYKKLKIIMFETDVDTFNIMVSNFLQELRNDSDGKDFATFFESKYVNNSSTWAYCFRKNCKINTNMKLENMHKILKHIYFEGKKVKRMDKAIFQIMNFIRDKLFNRLIVLHKGKISSKLSDLRKRHITAQHLNCIVVENETHWSVTSSSNNEIYFVERSIEECNKDTCQLTCNECDSCIHSFSCNCIDFAIKWNMCKHIHIVCTWLKNRNKNNEKNLPLNQVENIILDQEASTILHNVSKAKSVTFDKRKEDILIKFTELHKKIENEEQLNAFKKNVDALEVTLLALNKSKDNLNDFPSSTSTREPSNTKIEPQRNFFSTKKRKRKQENNICNPSSKEKLKLSLEMVGLK